MVTRVIYTQNTGPSSRQEKSGNYDGPKTNSNHPMPRQDNSTQERRVSYHLETQENSQRSDQHQPGEHLAKSDQIGGNQEQEWKPLTTSSLDGNSIVLNDPEREHRPVYAEELKELQNT